MQNIYPPGYEVKTGFDRIRQMLLDNCYSSLGRKHIGDIEFSTNKELISQLLDQTEEFRQIILTGENFPGSNYFDPEEVFRQIRPEDTYAEPEALTDIRLSLITIIRVIDFLKRTGDNGELKYPALNQLTATIEPDRSLPGHIDSVVDENSGVRSSASVELAGIRRKKEELEKKSLSRVNSILVDAKAQGLVSSDTELALRNGRQVIPLPVAYKRRIRGFVHDHSSTGQTAFLEPEEVFDLNNRIRDLEGEERQEIIRILKAIAGKIRPMLPGLLKAYNMLGQMDAVRAKATLAFEMGAMKPRLTGRPLLGWVNARHPLLYLSYKKQDKHVEPLTIELDRKNRILIISGPNAGGKSVCLKTCGLIQYMIQCGLPAPMDSYSEAGIFSSLFIDIGDEQSIENDLSTYSSHLLNMKHLLGNCDDSTLFLIDEFGAGTEPRIGGAIAEAILEKLSQRGAIGVISTHYANLKLMAGKHEGIINGSMLFDSKQMKPLYRLRTGNPGSSFAFEIARSIGLSPDLLKRAGSLAGDKELGFDVQLQDLEVKKAELEKKEQQLRHADNFLSEIIDKYEKLRDELEGRKNEILAGARKEAKDILSGTNKMIENTIREIKEAQADKERTKYVRKRLGEFIEQEDSKLRSVSKPVTSKTREKQDPTEPEVMPGNIGPGDTVRVRGQHTPGEIEGISGKKARVVFGSIKLSIDIDKLEKIRKQPGGKMSGSRMSFDINTKAATFNPDLDIRGDRVDQALQKLQSHLDDAYLLGVPQIRILHGKGDGILRPAVQSFLKETPNVSRFRSEHPDRGGAGITIVDFRQ